MSEVYYQPTLTAIWNPARGVWEKNQASLLCEHWGLFSEVWPSSGMMRNGLAYELPMQVLHIADSESLSSPILPTPAVAHLRNHDEDLENYQGRRQDFIDGKTKGMPGASLGVAVRLQQEGIELLRSPKASEGQGGALGEAEALKRGNTVGVRDQVMDLVAGQGLKVSRVANNLPTPTASDWKGANNSGSGSASANGLATVAGALLPTPNTMEHREIKTPEQIADLKAKSPGGYRNLRESVVNELLPTVTTQDGKNNGGPSQFDRNTKPLNTQVLVGSEWGKFEPAIRRWEEVLGRPAPAPTNPDGKDGAHRLSSRFTEWMMGLPDGWVTDCGLTRNEELKACGNGVVPQQAELALRILLEGVTVPAGGGQVNLPTPTVSDTFTGNLASTQQKEGSMHSVTLPQAVERLKNGSNA